MSCKKKKYKDEIAAMFALSQCKRGKGQRQEIRFYYCRDCNSWHLTKQNKRNGKRKEANKTSEVV